MEIKPDILSSSWLVIVYVQANNRQFTHQGDSQQQNHPTGVVFMSKTPNGCLQFYIWGCWEQMWNNYIMHLLRRKPKQWRNQFQQQHLLSPFDDSLIQRVMWAAAERERESSLSKYATLVQAPPCKGIKLLSRYKHRELTSLSDILPIRIVNGRMVKGWWKRRRRGKRQRRSSTITRSV